MFEVGNVDSPVLGEKANLVCLNVENQDDVLMQQAAHHKEGLNPLKAGWGYRVGKNTKHLNYYQHHPQMNSSIEVVPRKTKLCHSSGLSYIKNLIRLSIVTSTFYE